MHDLISSNGSGVEIQPDTPAPMPIVVSPGRDLVQVAYQFSKFLQSLPSKSATASQACKFVYENFPPSCENLNRHGRLHGLCKVCHTSSLKVQHLVGRTFSPLIRASLIRSRSSKFVYRVTLPYSRCRLNRFRVTLSQPRSRLKLHYRTVLFSKIVVVVFALTTVFFVLKTNFQFFFLRRSRSVVGPDSLQLMIILVISHSS